MFKGCLCCFINFNYIYIMELAEKQTLPKWFNGELYKKGDEVQNPFSGATYFLNAMELSMYDFIMGTQMIIDARGGLLHPATRDLQVNMAKGLSWFRKWNSKAYMVLLD